MPVEEVKTLKSMPRQGLNIIDDDLNQRCRTQRNGARKRQIELRLTEGQGRPYQSAAAFGHGKGDGLGCDAVSANQSSGAVLLG